MLVKFIEFKENKTFVNGITYHHFLAQLICKVEPSNYMPLRAANAVPALNSSLNSMKAKFLGAKRTSLYY